MSDAAAQIFEALIKARIDAFIYVDELIDALIPLAFKCECQGKDAECSEVTLNDAYANGQYDTLMRLRGTLAGNITALKASTNAEA